MGVPAFRVSNHKEDIAYDYHLLFLEINSEGKNTDFIVLFAVHNICISLLLFWSCSFIQHYYAIALSILVLEAIFIFCRHKFLSSRLSIKNILIECFNQFSRL